MLLSCLSHKDVVQSRPTRASYHWPECESKERTDEWLRLEPSKVVKLH